MIRNLCNKVLKLTSNTLAGPFVFNERRKDHVSHFVLRLAFCRSYVVFSRFLFSLITYCYREELRRRFIKAETTLFRIRFEDEIASERTSFLQSLKKSESNKIDWEEVCTLFINVIQIYTYILLRRLIQLKKKH